MLFELICVCSFADRKAKVPCTKYHKFPVGSVTKPFTYVHVSVHQLDKSFKHWLKRAC